MRNWCRTGTATTYWQEVRNEHGHSEFGSPQFPENGFGRSHGPGDRLLLAGATRIVCRNRRCRPAALNAWIHIGTDDIVTVMIDKSEMAGIMTALSMLAAEKLECDWKKTSRPNCAEKVYYNPACWRAGNRQGVRASAPRTWPLLQGGRGSPAREMLVAAAAQKWGVDKSDCRAVQNKRRSHIRRRNGPYS